MQSLSVRGKTELPVAFGFFPPAQNKLWNSRLKPRNPIAAVGLPTGSAVRAEPVLRLFVNHPMGNEPWRAERTPLEHPLEPPYREQPFGNDVMEYMCWNTDAGYASIPPQEHHREVGQ